MKGKYIDGQCTVGKIAANIFYLPAWFLKVAKIIIYYLVKYSDLLDEVEDRLISLLEGHHKTTTVITGEFSGTV